ERIDLAGLDQGQDLEELIHGPETARHDDDRRGIAQEHHLADEEIVEIHRPVDVGIGLLLERKLDIASDRPATRLMGASVSGLHDAGTPTGNDGKTLFGKAESEFAGRLIIRGVLNSASRTENGDRGADITEG